MAEYVDIPTPDGHTLRIVYELTVGDLLVVSFVALLLFAFLLNGLIKRIWRR